MTLFGQPSPEIDANWQDYIGKRHFSVSEEEAKASWGDSYLEFVDHRLGGFTVE